MGDKIHLVPSATDLKSSPFSLPQVYQLSDEDDFPLGSVKDSSTLPIPRLLVLEPEVLISGTTVATAAAGGCARRAVLQHLWSENEPLEVASTELAAGASTSASEASKPTVNVMLVGSVVHEVFQEVSRFHLLAIYLA